MGDYEVFKNIQKHISLSDLELQYLRSLLVVRNVQKKTFIQKQGQFCKKLFFVELGSLRAFHLDNEGKESTIMFAVKDWWITDMNSFVNQKPAMVSIEAINDSKIIALEFKLLQELFQKIPKFERFFRILFQNAYIREQQRAFHNISLSTDEKYWQFVKKYPAIVSKVTQKQIASYLGVTPEFLSSVKKK